jgi:hypothetical protein
MTMIGTIATIEAITKRMTTTAIMGITTTTCGSPPIAYNEDRPALSGSYLARFVMALEQRLPRTARSGAGHQDQFRPSSRNGRCRIRKGPWLLITTDVDF